MGREQALSERTAQDWIEEYRQARSEWQQDQDNQVKWRRMNAATYWACEFLLERYDRLRTEIIPILLRDGETNYLRDEPSQDDVLTLVKYSDGGHEVIKAVPPFVLRGPVPAPAAESSSTAEPPTADPPAGTDTARASRKSS